MLAENLTWRQQVKLFSRVLGHVEECIKRNSVVEVINVRIVVKCSVLRIAICIDFFDLVVVFVK